jgi:hypothetical protein
LEDKLKEIEESKTIEYKGKQYPTTIIEYKERTYIMFTDDTDIVCLKSWNSKFKKWILLRFEGNPDNNVSEQIIEILSKQYLERMLKCGE